MLRIHLLGPFIVELDGQSVTSHDWCTQQTQTIAKILIARRGQVVTSDQLIDILWPNETTESMRRRLHVRISQLRKALKENGTLVQTVHDGYLFKTDQSCWVDVDAFQRLIAQGLQEQDSGQHRQAILAYEQARGLYRGDFLSEDLYASWTFAPREQYREEYLNLLLQLSECYAQQGRYRLAIATAQQAQELDQLRESIYVRLILYHYYAGDRTQALNLYDCYREILEKELGVFPLESTDQLVEQIRMGTLWKQDKAPRYPPPIYEGRLFEVPYALDEIPFVDRDREYAWLVSQWRDPAKQVITIAGEAGIGKSRLVSIFAGYLTAQGAQILLIRLAPDENTPTATIINSLRPLLTDLVMAQLKPITLAVLAQHFPELNQRVKALPPLPNLPLSAERQRFFQALSDLFTYYTDVPMLLIVDDAHRLNDAAIDLLIQLKRNCKILLSYRGEETPANHPVRTNFGPPGLTLQPLKASGVQSMIRQLSGGDHPVIHNEISAVSQGNPLFVVALLQHMFESGMIYVDSSGDWQMTAQETPLMPQRLQDAIETRLDKLDRNQRRIFDYAAVMGGEFSFERMHAATNQPEDILLSILDNLVDSALIVESHRASQADFRINHDLYIEVAYEHILPVRRKLMHLQVAQAIESSHTAQLQDVYAELAEHYDRAEKAQPTVHYATLAGEQAAARYASQEALHFFERALAYLPEDAAQQRARLFLAREQVYDLSGLRANQAADLSALEALIPHLAGEIQAEIYYRQAGYAWIMGDNNTAERAVEKAIHSAQTSNAPHIEARALYLAGKIASTSTHANQFLFSAQKLARQTAQRTLEGDIVRWLGNLNFWNNNYTQSQAYLEEALAIHREVGDIRGELSALNNLGHLFEALGQLQTSVAYYQQAGEICEKINDRLAEGVILTNLGGLLTQLGQYEQAENKLLRARVVRSEIGNEEGVAVVHNDLGDVYRQQGRYQLALEHYQKAIDINTHIGHHGQKGEALTGRSVLYRELGAHPLAQANLAQAFTELTDPDAYRHIRATIEESLLNSLQGDYDKALAIVEQALAKTDHLPTLQANAFKNLGHTLAGLQRWEPSRQAYQQAVTLYNQLGKSHLAVEPLAGLAQIALSGGHLDQALRYAEDILPALVENPLQGPDRTLWIYLTVFQVLQQNEDVRAAKVLKAAFTLLQKRSAAITDQDLRTSYLENIPENRQISQLWGMASNNK